MEQIIKLDPKPDFIIDEINKSSPRKYVRVIADNFIYFDANREVPVPMIKPLVLVSSDGRQFEIDYTSEPIKCASLRSGGAGLRYTCRIRNTVYYLFLEDCTWFIERV